MTYGGTDMSHRPSCTKIGFLAAALALPISAMAVPSTAGANTAGFSNTVLISTTTYHSATTTPNANSTGNSEPAIAFGADGTMVVDGLAWVPSQVDLWKGRFGSTPAIFGAMDTDLQNVGKGLATRGDEDADAAVTSSDTTLLADLNLSYNNQFTGVQLGVDVTRCPAASATALDCTHSYLDTAGADRPWITTAGQTAWVAYHDAASSTLIHIQRSSDDGRTWRSVHSPIPGQGSTTGAATFNNLAGPIVADPSSGDLYSVYVAGDPQSKGSHSEFSNIYVARSTDGGENWTTTHVYHADPPAALDKTFPSLAVDPSTHAVYSTWSDARHVWVSTSTDRGLTWSPAEAVSTATTAVMPWLAALGGKVDVVYYGTDAASVDDQSAVWNVYDSQYAGGAWTVKQVSNTPNRVGAVCVAGSVCADDRQLLDLFEVAEDPITGKAAVIYTDSTIDTWTFQGITSQLPEIVLAFET
jgi:hypothetical protein